MSRWLLGPLDRRARLILLGGLVLRAILLLAGPARLDRAFVVDDAYYTLTIARSLAHQGIPSVDGSEISTGFQPLLALFEAPAFLLGASPDVGLLWGLCVLLAADLLIATLLARVATRAAGAIAGLAAAAIWSLSAIAFREALVGLEGPLAVATGLLAASLLGELDETGDRKKALVAGLAIGACLLARIDTVFFILLVGAWLLWKRRDALIPVVGGALLVAGPWLITCLALSGRPWPESGAAVRSLVGEGDDLVSLARCAGWAAGYVVPGGLVDLPELRDWLVAHPAFGAGLCVLFLGGAAYAAMRLPIKARLWVFGALALVPFYVLVLPAIWSFHRYLLPARVATTLLLAMVVAKVGMRLAVRVRKLAGASSLVVLTANAILVTLAALESPLRGGSDGTTGYRAIALAIHANVPPGSTIGAAQSGAIGYFRPEGTRVVNLDGVVSRSAHRAFVERRLDEHIQANGVTHLAEWTSGLREIRDRSARKLKFRPYFATEPQGRFRFYVTPVAWEP